MKKVALFAAFLFLISCQDFANNMGCGVPSVGNQAWAQSYLDEWDSFYDPNITEEQAIAIFGCHYRRGDRIYVQKTLWKTRYILSRYNHGYTYVEK